ncbi:MAG: DUF3089 domain-containing protein [Spirochaetales bacterium]|jgi:hypothetical protein|nr:DUF3089 domain-containing protein [Spirochaetales bacterium]
MNKPPAPHKKFFSVKRICVGVITALLLCILVLYIQTHITAARYAKEVGASPANYALAENWLSLQGENGDKPADVFFLYPTCYFVNEKEFCALDDPDMREEAQKLRDAHIGIFDYANFYAPYYRQLSIPYIEKTLLLGTLNQAVAAVPLQDCKNAFEYYLRTYNRGKPIIFASHSQGTVVMKEILVWVKEKYPELLERTIAAYLIGFTVNEDYVKKTGLDFTGKSDDTGVIISYNTESPGVNYNPFTFMRRGTLVVNPINWKRDETYAGKEESLGSHIRFGDAPPVDRFHFADAQINQKRGTVITNAEVTEDYWSRGVLHRYDYDLFYYDLQHNVRKRMAVFFEKRASRAP